MLSIYPACFIKEETGYSAVFPDLNYLAAGGETLDKTLAAAVDCLAGYLYWLQKYGEQIPEPSPISSVSIETVVKDLGLNPQEAFVNLVSVEVTDYAKKHFEKSVKKTLTIPAWMNESATAMGINFSQVLQEALLNKLQGR